MQNVKENILSVADQFHWRIVIPLCATLGIGPFSPSHIVENLIATIYLIGGNLKFGRLT
jgi:hypothetical protein